MNLLFLPSGGELIIVLAVVLLLFGAKSIPDIARMLGKGMNEFRRASDEIKRELRDQTSDIRDDINDTRSFIDDEVDNVKKAVDTDLSDDKDPYELANGTAHDESEPEVTSNKKKNAPASDIPEVKDNDGPVSREDLIED